ncbi:MAG: glycoside hydrolase family 172 protein [Bacteroidota bacterium]
MKKYIISLSLAFALFSYHTLFSQEVTTSSLLDELTDLKRLSELSGPQYQVLNFSSYDRQSSGKYKDQRGWYQNSDGFGNEPFPNFERVIEPADSDGNGKFVICDVKGPGAIVREWSAKLNGEVMVYLDNNKEPVYQGSANYFFRHTYDAITGVPEDKTSYDNTISQSFSGYYPIPFAERLRIEWSGNLKELHFYILQIRQYAEGTRVVTFNPGEIETHDGQIERVKAVLSDPMILPLSAGAKETTIPVVTIPKMKKRSRVLQLTGGGAIEKLSIKVHADDLEKVLRQGVLHIVFDDYVHGQVQAPLGDFFNTAMGIDPLNSLPFTVGRDSVLTCRFVMPYKESASIWIDNFSDQDIEIEGTVHTTPLPWEEGKTMYLHTTWRIDHNITAEEYAPVDLVVLMAHGRGRYVGTSVFLKNPATGPNNWGNWWGEGDEKVYIDDDRFPRIFGTGTEDYFGYAWSSSDLFNYAYIGQPRNDGPGNRGFVTNYRFHVIDDYTFNNNLSFFMELYPHDSIPEFTYGRMAYYYALDGSYDDHEVITEDDVRIPVMTATWRPKAIKGSKGFTFHEAEEVLTGGKHAGSEAGHLWSDAKLLQWKPVKKGEKLTFEFSAPAGEKMEVLLTLKKSPEGGRFSIKVNGEMINNGAVYELYEPWHTISHNIYLPAIEELKEKNKLELIYEGGEGGEIGVDFIWVRVN